MSTNTRNLIDFFDPVFLQGFRRVTDESAECEEIREGIALRDYLPPMGCLQRVGPTMSFSNQTEYSIPSSPTQW